MIEVWAVVVADVRGRRPFTRMLDAAEIVVAVMVVIIHQRSGAWINGACTEGGVNEETP